jgi:hypothetical protein
MGAVGDPARTRGGQGRGEGRIRCATEEVGCHGLHGPTTVSRATWIGRAMPGPERASCRNGPQAMVSYLGRVKMVMLQLGPFNTAQMEL